MPYIVIILLQAYCFYHAYTRRVEIWWYFLIFFFPLIGCGFYLFRHFNTPAAMETIGNVVEDVRGTIDNSYKSRQLEKQLDFSDTVQNKLQLGTEYMNTGYYEDAYALFESCNNGVFENDPEILSKLVVSSYMLRDYEETIRYGEQPAFKNDPSNQRERTAVAWAYFYSDRKEDAELLFHTFDKSYGAYFLRNEHVKYLRETDQEGLARTKMVQLQLEIENMDRHERRANAEDVKAIQATSKTL